MKPAVFCALISGLFSSLALAQDTTTPPPAATGASKGVYTAGQAERGEKLFGKICIECHESFEFSGTTFDKDWLGKSAFDFFDLVKTKMPDDNPGTLKREDVVDVLAYILKLNNYPPGPSELPNDDEKLKQIPFDAKPPTPPPPPNRARR
jgi:mono/diheme cytochrome c family protein